MAEQQYRVIVQDWMKNWGYTALTSNAAQADIIDRLVRIERPVSTTDEPKQILMTHPHDGHGPDDTCLNCAAECGARHEHRPGHHESPSLPTREQIGEAIYTVRAGSNANWHKAAFRDDYLLDADAVLALLQKGADRG